MGKLKWGKQMKLNFIVTDSSIKNVTIINKVNIGNLHRIGASTVKLDLKIINTLYDLREHH